MFKKILVANRGEIACRVIKTASKMGIATVAIYSDADVNSLHIELADESIRIGSASVNESYISIERVIEAVKVSGADAVHPGYGFLSENPIFAEKLEALGVVFIGPPANAIKLMGDKITSKKIAQESGVSTVPGYMGLIKNAEHAVSISNEIGYPVMIKASAGGGGKGMRISGNDKETRESFQSAKNEAESSFGDGRLFIEKFISQPRHIEIQVLADAHSNCVYLGERECSIQRRNQKMIEEAPSPFLNETTRKKMGNQACELARSVGYTSAGTVEFIVDKEKNFYFLEMNTRLQVEHPVTELITGIDLVEQMIQIASGAVLTFEQQDITLSGWAVESRLYAEDPYRNFLPSIGRLSRYRPPEEVSEQELTVRNDTGVYEGGEISIFYDPMIAKLCTWSPTRNASIIAMRDALDGFEIEGVEHNIPFLSAVMGHQKFIDGNITTAFIEEEYPEGFQGVNFSESDLKQLAAGAVAMFYKSEIRRSQISGQISNSLKSVGTDWCISLQGSEFLVSIDALIDSAIITYKTGEIYEISTDWKPGFKKATVYVDKDYFICKVTEITGGFRFKLRGADLKIYVRLPNHAKLASRMLKKKTKDLSKSLICPMPGLLISLSVSVGDTVEEGQALCTVEAMKMENILRSETKGVIKKINANMGDNLAVDYVILEFE